MMRHEMSEIVMRYEMSDKCWMTWDPDMRWLTWDGDLRWVTWDEWHVMSDMWLTDSDPIPSVISLFWTLWETLCLTLFFSLEARLSDVMMNMRWVTWDRAWDEWETPWNAIPILLDRRTLRDVHKLLWMGWAEVTGNIMRWLVGRGHGQKLKWPPETI